MATAKRFKNEIKDDKIVSSKAPTKNTVSADAGSKGTRFIPYVDKGTATAKTTETPTRYKNTVDQEITNTPKKVRGVNMPKDIPALTAKATDTITTKIADKVVSKAADKAPATAKEVIKKVVAKSAPVKSELDTMKSSNPALRRQFADNSRLAQAIRSSDYGNDEDIARQAKISEADKFFRDRGVGTTTAMKKGGVTKKPAVKKLAKGGAVSLKPITGKALKPLSSKSITQAAKGMQKAVKPARPAKGFATGGAVKCSKSSKSINGGAKRGLTRAARAK